MTEPDPPPGGQALELARMTYVEVEAALARPEPKIALLPTGSTEAHGPHLPLATDSIISEEMARRAAEQLAGRGMIAVRLPALHYAVTDWAADFAGSAGITKDTAQATLLELARRCGTLGFDATVLINAHLEPDNIATLRGVTRAYAESGAPGRLLFPDNTRRRNAARLTDEFRSGSCHAGQYETSLVLAVDPSLVRTELARALPEHHVPLHEHIARGATSFADCGLDQAYCGDPAGASAAEGHATYDALAAIVVDAVTEALEAQQ
ncbi:Creatinine amidohydrolase [Enhygromyxa salina]|uniref:Creatinine amidohydrolase n=1 Tax=Enhygromyxa salina TaxID=215803 RepID=A0A2S9XK62_9BACT|nr:creatininase family protein [Enhygromyxa salina]PRP93243.1 Creatinine amidohydrolase [Enhygromyxa salina]